MPLPRHMQTECQAVGFAAITPGAAWEEVSATGAGAATALTRLDASSRAAASLTQAVEVTVSNQAAAGGDTIYATCTDPGAGAATLGIPVLPQSSQSIPLYGTGTPPRVWVYGAAAAPTVVVAVSMTEGA